MGEYSRKVPVVALRGMAVLPGMVIHFDINRKISMEAIENAMENDQLVLLVTQKDPETEKPGKQDLYQIGTIAEVKQIIKLPGNVIRVLVNGTKRARLEDLIEEESYLVGEVEVLNEEIENQLSEAEKKAMIRGLKDILEVYFIENPKIGKEVAKQLMKLEEVHELIDQIAVNVPLSLEDKQDIIETVDLIERYQTITVILTEEIDVIRIKKDLQAKVKEKVDKNQKDYILREQLKIIREELGETNTATEAENYLAAVTELTAKEDVKEKISKEIERFKNLSGNSSESAVSRGYIETLLALPWDKVSTDKADVNHAEKILNEDHYGLDKVKERILEFLAVRVLTQKGDSPILCLVGPPGTGKTSIARSVAKALNKEYVRISLGGVRDEAEIRGHRRTYVGALPGRIATGLKNAGVKNPLMLLDEIDKVSSDYKGDISSALLEVLDGEQNSKFVDHYVEIPVDLSEILFIATANSVQTIPKPLLDRMELIEVTSYTENEKHHIAKKHLIPKQIRKNGLELKQLGISDKALQRIISGYTKEAGVRNLERKVGELCRKAAKEIVSADTAKVKITDKNLEKYLGKEKYSFQRANTKDEVGIVRGLAWTSVGGDTLQIEVNVMPGKGKFELTGQLGDVMKESARAGISFIRSVSRKYGIEPDYFDKNDIHIHIPEGAVPKDGPSAGITMATAMLSAITDQPVRADVAMTGEITLRGRVLPIGGLKEKILAAKTAKIKLVLVPKQNKKDVEEIAAEILEGIEVKFMDTMEEVLEEALVQKA
ncbi:Lon protease [Anaerocolumna cellulosilytica]|uniref:Lon protease n=1 Tax=Anaerocolumna cellulosilytica TaxID=433286 RepID=A0A6S6RCL2_9FIRM|nr:endopeptidase La [Anaerocolumna cellulosilytica]MBB5197726.1 ATP-dependent Lon protease [Anaerocolumna cellulosilytica]BCJ96481.1 Lon protease [Anaerocolumna cellulosilytica]